MKIAFVENALVSRGRSADRTRYLRVVAALVLGLARIQRPHIYHQLSPRHPTNLTHFVATMADKLRTQQQLEQLQAK